MTTASVAPIDQHVSPAEAGLRVEGLSVRYPLAGSLASPRRELVAVTDVSFTLRPGETLGIVGESGCGKSSLARALVRLAPVSSGQVSWDGADLTGLSNAQLRTIRPQIQMVFQDPFAALNPRIRMFDLLAEPLITHRPRMPRSELRRRVLEAVDQVGLHPDMINRFPHEFSGGQAQRIGIGRAIISRPRLLICDEAVSALDVSVQALIIELLSRLQAELGLAILFISHDLAVVRQISQRVIVLYLGRVAEHAPREALFSAPRHPYTAALIGSALSSNPAVERGRPAPPIGTDLPSPISPPSGCPFHPRCPAATEICATRLPPMSQHSDGHTAACHHPIDGPATPS